MPSDAMEYMDMRFAIVKKGRGVKSSEDCT
jgi:hypothetical protein